MTIDNSDHHRPLEVDGNPTHRIACVVCTTAPVPKRQEPPPPNRHPAQPRGLPSHFARTGQSTFHQDRTLTQWESSAPTARSTPTRVPVLPVAPAAVTRGPRSTPESREAADCLEAVNTLRELATVANAHRANFLKSGNRPATLSDAYFLVAISRVLEPSNSVTDAPTEQMFDWSNAPPLPPSDALQFEEIKAHAVGPAP
jgi:hypothetical protein